MDTFPAFCSGIIFSCIDHNGASRHFPVFPEGSIAVGRVQGGNQVHGFIVYILILMACPLSISFAIWQDIFTALTEEFI